VTTLKIVGFWKISSKISPAKTAEIAAKLLEKGLYPPEGMEIVEWLICPGGRGVIVAEVPDEMAALSSWLVWENAEPGYFEYIEMMPAVEAKDAISLVMKQSKKKK